MLSTESLEPVVLKMLAKKIQEGERKILSSIMKKVEMEMSSTTTVEDSLQYFVQLCSSQSHLDKMYDEWGATILECLHDMKTEASFFKTMQTLQQNLDVHGNRRPLLSEPFFDFIQTHQDTIEEIYTRVVRETEHERHIPSIFGWKTLYQSYLMKSNGHIRERLPHLWYRVSLFLHGTDWTSVETCFRDFLKGQYTHATPTLFYAGAHRAQMASCFNGSTMIYTLERGLVPIEDVHLGEHVFTHRKRWKPVLQRHENSRMNRHMYSMFVDKNHVGECTQDHPFLTWNHKNQCITWTRVDEMKSSAIYGYHHLLSFDSFEYTSSVVLNSMTTPSISLYSFCLGYIFAWVHHRLVHAIPFRCHVSTQEIEFCFPSVLTQYMAQYMTIHETDGWKYSTCTSDSSLWTFLTAVENGDSTDLTDPLEYEALISLCRRQDGFDIDSFFKGWKELNSPFTCSTSLQQLYETLSSLLGSQDKKSRTFKRKRHGVNPDIVYTLGVQDDHSYTTDGGFIAKNCFLVGTEDSVYHIFKTLGDVAQISKWAGGLGIHVSNIRANQSYIYGTNGQSNGILPMIRLYNDTSRYIDQCFSKHTRIFTTRGWIPIHTAMVGDLVLTQYGSFAPIHHIRTYRVTSKDILYQYNDIGDIVNGVTWDHDMMVKRGDNSTMFESWSNLCPTDKLHFVQPRFVQDYEYMDDMYFQLLGFLCSISLSQDHVDIDSLTWGDLYTYRQTIEEPDHDEETTIPSVFFANMPMSWILSHCMSPFPSMFFFLPLEKLNTLYSCLPSSLWKHHTLAHETILYRLSPPPEWMSLSDFFPASRQYQCSLHDTSEWVYDLDIADGYDPTYLTSMGVAHNGGGKRNGAFAIYLEPWHADIMAFLHAKKSTGPEEERARDLFYGLWIPDLFMKRVENNEHWSLMCPAQSKRLHEVWGEEFDILYQQYEQEGKFISQLPARELWTEIVRTQMETGTPYMLYKDACNSKSNQRHLGTIRSSNLCTEIIEYSDHKEYAVCNLGSIALPKCLVSNVSFEKAFPSRKLLVVTKESCLFCRLLKGYLSMRPSWDVTYIQHSDVDTLEQYDLPIDSIVSYPTIFSWTTTLVCLGGFQDFFDTYLRPVFDFDRLYSIVYQLTRNLNKVIDKNIYPVPETEWSNKKHRPIGIGVQGLADVFGQCRFPFDSDEAKRLNIQIFETLYFAALTASVDLAESEDGPYGSFHGSPLSHGQFHFDLCPGFSYASYLSDRWDWEHLRHRVQTIGTRNSLFIAPMPTASTSQILGNNECFEPFTSNLYLRRTMVGEFYIVNSYLRQDLQWMGLWTTTTIEALLVDKGSIQSWSHLPSSFRHLYRTVWEIPQKSLLDMAYDRHFFIDQSQSLNLFVSSMSLEKLTKMHFYSWKKGLKTGCYYIRSRPVVSSPTVVVTPSSVQHQSSDVEHEPCLSCSA